MEVVVMKDKLQKLNIRLTELAAFIGVSRPTLYKYLNEYETNQYKNIDHDIVLLFDYIMKSTTFSKLQVMEFIGKMRRDYQSTDMPFINVILECGDGPKERELLIKTCKLLTNNRFRLKLESLINKYQI